jgi:hypothetical protein
MDIIFVRKLTLFEGQGISKSVATPRTQSPKQFNTGKTITSLAGIPFDVSYSAF